MYTLTPKQWQALGWSLAVIVVVIIILLIVFLRKKNNGGEESSPPPFSPSPDHLRGMEKENQEGTLRPIPSYMPRADNSLPEMPFITAPPRPGMESLRPGMESLRPGMESARPGMESLRPGMESLRPSMPARNNSRRN